MANEKDDEGNFFKTSTYNEVYWDRYLQARPTYDHAFYNQILTYFHSHGNNGGIAHDIGTGPGQVAAQLAPYFDEIIASDNNKTHLEIAAMRHEKAGIKDKVTLSHSSAEDLSQNHPAGQAGLVTVAECMPLLDQTRALETFAHILRPNGTLAIWFYGRPAFTDPEHARTCQPLLNEILDLMFEQVIKGQNATQKASWMKASECLDNFLDNIALPSDTWVDIERWKWNSHLPMSFYSADARDFPVQRVSAIDVEREKVIEKQDPGFWAKKWDSEEMRCFAEQLMPPFEQMKAKGLFEHIEPKFGELESAMGGKGVKRSVTWPVVLILATRRAVNGA